jgi:hypothetical protein
VIIVGLLFYRFGTPKLKAVAAAACTAGNTSGTLLVLGIFFVFNDQPIVGLICLLLGCFVLIKMARGSVLHIEKRKYYPHILNRVLISIKNTAMRVLLLSHHDDVQEEKAQEVPLSVLGVALVSFIQPFTLGLDDMAVYISLINLYSAFSICFAIIVSHWLLTSAMLATSKLKKFFGFDPLEGLVKDPIFTIIGILLFVYIAVHSAPEIVHLVSKIAGHH